MTLTNWKCFAAVTIALLVLVVAWFGLAPLQVRWITNDELTEALGVIEAGNPNTAYWYSFVGETNGTVYIEYETMIHPLGLLTNKPKKTVLVINGSDVSDRNTQRIVAVDSAL